MLLNLNVFHPWSLATLVGGVIVQQHLEGQRFPTPALGHRSIYMDCPHLGGLTCSTFKPFHSILTAVAHVIFSLSLFSSRNSFYTALSCCPPPWQHLKLLALYFKMSTGSWSCILFLPSMCSSLEDMYTCSSEAQALFP